MFLTHTISRRFIVDRSPFILGYRIPKGAVILGNIWHMLHDSEIWKEPNTFKPERFLDDNGKVDRKADVMLPFGIGNYTHQDSDGFLYGALL